MRLAAAAEAVNATSKVRPELVKAFSITVPKYFLRFICVVKSVAGAENMHVYSQNLPIPIRLVALHVYLVVLFCV